LKITGGAGFIGRFVADELLARGNRVRVLDSLIEQVHGAGPPAEIDGAELFRADVRDAAAVREATQDSDVDVRETTIRLREYRKVRDKARQRLEESERDLRELLSVRQEGILVMLGLLN